MISINIWLIITKNQSLMPHPWSKLSLLLASSKIKGQMPYNLYIMNIKRKLPNVKDVLCHTWCGIVLRLSNFTKLVQRYIVNKIPLYTSMTWHEMQYAPCELCLFRCLPWWTRLRTMTHFIVFWWRMSIVGLRLTATRRCYFETVNVKMVADLLANWRRKNQHVYCAENLKHGKIF